MWNQSAKIIAMSGMLATLPVSAHCLDQDRLTGVNLAGAEFNSKSLPGKVDKDYVYPTLAEFEFIASQGANVVRLPIRWERIQPTLGEPLNPAELGFVITALSRAKTTGLCVILDIHNYGRYYEASVNSVELQKAFIELWRLLVKALDEKYFLALGLMNEPSHISIADWASLAKQTVSALREAGATQLIFVGGGNWSGLHSWFSQKDGVSNAQAFATLKDPLNKTIIEVHQYADKNYSGTAMDCYPPEHFDAMFERIRLWAVENKQQLFLGEFGFAATPECLTSLTHFLKLMEGPEWKGWTYWASGRWWGKYGLALNSSSTAPSLQWGPLKKGFFVNPEPKNPPQAPSPL